MSKPRPLKAQPASSGSACPHCGNDVEIYGGVFFPRGALVTIDAAAVLFGRRPKSIRNRLSECREAFSFEHRPAVNERPRRVLTVADLQLLRGMLTGQVKIGGRR